jgi:hypothetical protein
MHAFFHGHRFPSPFSPHTLLISIQVCAVDAGVGYHRPRLDGPHGQSKIMIPAIPEKQKDHTDSTKNLSSNIQP